MYRCITEAKGFLIDADSFADDIKMWEFLVDRYKCIFLTANEETAKSIIENYGEEYLFKIPNYERWFIPNSRVHSAVLKQMQVKTTEMVYISADLEFLNNAMTFLGGTIWINSDIDYHETSRMPDSICDSVKTLREYFKLEVKGFLGEVAIYPRKNQDSVYGSILPVKFEVDNTPIHMQALGRYFGSHHYMSQLHPYSSAIILNKRGKATGVYNSTFARLYEIAIKRLMQKYSIDGVCSVPPKPGEDNRFSSILDHVVKQCNIENYSSELISVREFGEQKGLTNEEREENVKGAFNYTGNLSGKSVVIFDDVITTGATVKECIRELKKAGAKDVFVIVLAINQMARNYWKAESPQVSCPKCGNKMKLWINSKFRSFFYSCPNCYKETLGFNEAMNNFHNEVMVEFLDEKSIENEDSDTIVT